MCPPAVCVLASLGNDIRYAPQDGCQPVLQCRPRAGYRIFEQAGFWFKRAIRRRYRVSMIGPTLIDIREHIEGLAVKGGQYYVVCGRTGYRPVPAAGNRFQDRAPARVDARATEQ